MIGSTLTPNEYKRLLEEAKSFEKYEQEKKKYNDLIDQYKSEKMISIRQAVSELTEQGVHEPLYPQVNPLCQFARDIHKHQGFFIPDKDLRNSFEEDIFRSRIRSWTIEGKAFSEEPESQSGRPGVRRFAQKTLKLTDEEIEDLKRFHSQPLVQQVFTQAIQYAGFLPNKMKMDFSANYYTKDGQKRLRVEQRYMRPDEDKSPLGTIQFEYVLTPRGFRLEKGYPLFSSSVFKQLFLAKKPNVIQITPQLIQLMRAEEELRKLSQDPVLDRGSSIEMPPSSNLPLAKNLLKELDENLMNAFEERNNRYIQDQIKKINEVKNALVIDRDNLLVESEDKRNLIGKRKEEVESLPSYQYLETFKNDRTERIFDENDEEITPEIKPHVQKLQELMEEVDKALANENASLKTITDVLTQAEKALKKPKATKKIAMELDGLKKQLSPSSTFTKVASNVIGGLFGGKSPGKSSEKSSSPVESKTPKKDT